MAAFLKGKRNDNLMTQDWICDSDSDINSINLDKVPIGSTLFVFSSSKMYELNSKKVWEEIQATYPINPDI